MRRTTILTLPAAACAGVVWWRPGGADGARETRDSGGLR